LKVEDVAWHSGHLISRGLAGDVGMMHKGDRTDSHIMNYINLEDVLDCNKP